MKARRSFSIVLPLALGLGVPAAHSQSTSQLHGIITDPQGAAITTAHLTLKAAGTGFNRQTVSNPSGEYQFLQVPPGIYALTVEMPGFASLTRSGVELPVNT